MSGDERKGKKIDIQSLVGVANETMQYMSVDHGIGAAVGEGVPPDMQRYVYYGRLHGIGAWCIVSIYEDDGTGPRLKFQEGVSQYQTAEIPDGGPSNNDPVLRFKGSSRIGVQCSNYTGSTSSMVEVNLEVYDMPS